MESNHSLANVEKKAVVSRETKTKMKLDDLHQP
jgi:hypothetical protein